jgi:MscS family membrane protein
MLRLLVVVLLAAVLPAQVLHAQNTEPVPSDPLGRMTPQGAVLRFLEACHAREYARAAHYLDLRQISPADRATMGPQLAQQLEDLLDDTPFDIATLSRDPEGDLSDGLTPSREGLATFPLDGKPLELDLERVELKPGFKVWLVTADSLPVIPKAHDLLTETPLEKKLPQLLVRHELLDTPVWRWIALLAIGFALWFAAGLLSRALVLTFGRLTNANAGQLRGPVRVCLAIAGFRGAMASAPPSALPRMYMERALALAFALGLAWVGAAAVDYVAERWRSRLDPRMKAMTYSVLPLGRQVIKLSLFLIAILGVVSAWGYNTATILAGLGVGGIAVALAAQKTIENLFGGISIISDRPVLVGDFCRFGAHMGTVMHIGLRSTRIRTLDRTVLSVPNNQFSATELENFSARDKIWFHVTLSLRRDATSDQVLRVVSAVRDILRQHSKVETGDIPVRLIGIGNYSLDVEVFAYVTTSDYDVFLGVQQELLIKMLQAVERVGAALAVPLLENSHAQEFASASRPVVSVPPPVDDRLHERRYLGSNS